jgi:hypothetical protein
VIFPSLSEFMHLNLNLAFFLSLSSDTYISPSSTFPSLLCFILHSTHTNCIVLFPLYCPNPSPSFSNFFYSALLGSNKKSVPKYSTVYFYPLLLS